jgi:hypothetical protein
MNETISFPERPAPPSAMVEAVALAMHLERQDHHDTWLPDWNNISDLAKSRYLTSAIAAIAAVFDNMPREAMIAALLARLPYDRADEWHAGDAFDAAISAARAAALGTKGDA